MSARIADSHATYTNEALQLREFIRKFPDVATISAGFIGHCGRPAPKRVKILDVSGAILLKVRGTTAIQEVRVYTKNHQATKLAIARVARDLGFVISFKE